MVSSDMQMEECAIQQGNAEDLHLLVHGPQERRYWIKGAFGMRGTLIAPSKLLTALAIKKNAILEEKKAESEVKPIVDYKDRRDPVLTIPLDPSHNEFVYGSSEGVHEENMRRSRGERRVRAPPEVVFRMIFDKFKERSYWTLKALGVALQQPDVSIC